MKKHKRAQSIAPRCPYCGGHSILRSADGIYKREGTEHIMDMESYSLRLLWSAELDMDFSARAAYNRDYAAGKI